MILVYATSWCAACLRVKAFLDRNQIQYQVIDIEKDSEAADKVMDLTGGFKSVPTIVFDDGKVLIEPSLDELAVRVGVVV